MSAYVPSPGYPPTVTYDERVAAALALTRAGCSAAEIAVRLGVSARTVARYRAKRRASA